MSKTIRIDIDAYEAEVAGLSDAQHRAYDLLLFWYYRTGGPLPKDDAGIWRIARSLTAEQQAASLWVRSRFFRETSTGWTHPMADEERRRATQISRKRKAAIRSRWGADTNVYTKGIQMYDAVRTLAELLGFIGILNLRISGSIKNGVSGEATKEEKKNKENKEKKEKNQKKEEKEEKEKKEKKESSFLFSSPKRKDTCKLNESCVLTAHEGEQDSQAPGQVELLEVGKRNTGDLSVNKSPAHTKPLPADKNAPEEPVCFNLPCVMGETYPVRRSDMDQWAEFYPAIDVETEVRKMLGWLVGNPDRRKTKRGAGRFIHTWLGKAQDKAGPPRERDHFDEFLSRQKAKEQQ